MFFGFYGNLNGLPAPTDPPAFSEEDFKIYIPKLAWILKEKSYRPILDKAIKKSQERLNYTIWQTDYDEAISLAVAHFLVQTLPEFAQSTDAAAEVGGVMTNRQVGAVSYNYDIDYTMPMGAKDGWAAYWLTTGYGRRLVTLALNRGFVGLVVT